MVAAFMITLLTMDGMLLHAMRKRAALRAEAVLAMGAGFVACSVAAVAWLLWAPGLLPFYATLG